MKGGVRLWCETLHHITVDEGWCETVVWDFAWHNSTSHNKPHWRVVWGWCETLHVDVNRIEMAAWMGTCCCKTHCNGCMTVTCGLFQGGSRSTKPCVFPCKSGSRRRLVGYLLPKSSKKSISKPPSNHATFGLVVLWAEEGKVEGKACARAERLTARLSFLKNMKQIWNDHTKKERKE